LLLVLLLPLPHRCNHHARRQSMTQQHLLWQHLQDININTVIDVNITTITGIASMSCST
jgi:hypothetical protein